MSLRATLTFAAALAALTGACAHAQHAESIPEAARAACIDEHVADADMSACIAQMSETIAAAREYRPEPAHPRTQPQHGAPSRPNRGT